MTWQEATTSAERLDALLKAIRTAGGTITSCRPEPGGYHVTWTAPTPGA